ncbi:MAG TPA: glycosyltransferase [Bacteroidales bacterium]|nr:glycosyltransferase [Bacteroidales bacterium]HRW95975.1 glycosyltransferase [Bacteroidales bacterium]
MTMKLSVVIVNYNVKHFLEQCLHSVRKASAGVPCEVFVVDNNSVDGSVKMVKEKFPEVKIIANQENLGFSKANNQAIKLAVGEYVLLLNPDTIVEDDTFVKILDFMDSHPEAGGLGVKMVDGQGKFLPESKRGLPTPAVAFYKIFGLARLFPKSKIFGQYHLSYLHPDKIHAVDVLSGAFMLIRKSVLDKIGGLDESYFMYGEDIDLSYRINLEGYKNYYFPETRIIHYKGESTKKSSINYVLVFYQAMIIFATKHFSQKNARLFSFLINLAVYFRASLAILRRVAGKVFLKVIDAVVIFGGIYFIQRYWATSVVFKDGGNYPIEFLIVAVPSYIFIWLLSVYLSGGYDKPISLYKIFRGLLGGTIVILVFYSLLDETLRYSRALILLGALWGYLAMMSVRYFLNLLGFKDFRIGENESRRYLVVGNSIESNRVASLLTTIETQPGFIGLVSFDESVTNGNFIGTFDQIREIVEIYQISEIIFCAKDIPSRHIIDKMSELKHLQVDYKIAPPESLSLIGSNTINTAGDLFTLELNSIGKISNRRNKRFLDVISALLMLLSLPVTIFIVKNPFMFLRNIFQVLLAKKTWVGYCLTKNHQNEILPDLRPGVLNPATVLHFRELNDLTLDRLNLLYARDYKTKNDINIILRGFRSLGNH